MVHARHGARPRGILPRAPHTTDRHVRPAPADARGVAPRTIP